MTRHELLAGLAGGAHRLAPMVILSAMARVDLGTRTAPRILGAMFNDDLLRATAQYLVGEIATYGDADLGRVRARLVARHRPEAVELVRAAVAEIAAIIEAADVAEALDILRRRRAA